MSGDSGVGSRFGHYELRSVLGRGGMGDVYEAFDTVKQRTVALKILPATLARDPDFAARFRREAQSAAVLTEPHVIPIHDWGDVDGQFYIDMRLVQGPSLRALISEAGPMPPARAVLIVSQIAAALDAAHAAGLVHRDVKPENILVTADGNDFAYLVDFGIAADAREGALTMPGTTIGTYAYMAPERFGDGPVTGRADIYSLACVLHETLTGARPFDASSPSAVIRAHLDAPPPRPSTYAATIPVAVDTVLARAMAKNPSDRFPTGGEFARAAQEAVARADPDAAGALTRRLTETAVLTSWTDYPPPYVAQPQPHWQPPHAPPPYAPPPPQARRSMAIPIVLTVLAIGVLALGGVVVALLLTRDSGGPDPTVAATVPRAAASTFKAPSATPVRPPTTLTPTTRPPTPTGPAMPPFIGSVSNMDGQGFLPPETPRCNATDPAVAVGRTTKSRLVVCQVAGVGRYYYKGMRTSDGLGIELDDAVRTGSGFAVTNPKDNTEYRIGPTALVIVDAQGQEYTEAMVEYAHR